jgi:hypothetical protein
VCLGHGLLDHPGAMRSVEPCHRCLGTGKCGDCGVIAVQDMQEPPPILDQRRTRRGVLRAIREAF